MKKLQIFASSLGNTLEWLDFGLFLLMAPLIGAKFFPHHSANIATLDALMVFAAGFICRPLGGVLFGHFGDTRGRAKTLRISVLIITLPTLLIGLMPSYDTIGITATVLFTFLRLAQGLSIGGEYSGVMIYLAESAPENRRGFITSFAATGANLGFLLATFLYLALTHFASTETINTWAWRLPFIFAGLPGAAVIYYRLQLTETPTYLQLKQQHHLEKTPFIQAIKYAPYSLLKIFGMTCMGSTFYYVFFGYMPHYLEHFVGFSLQKALTIQSGLLIAMLCLVPLAGLCGDYFSRKTMLFITAIAIMVFVIPCFYLLQDCSTLAVIASLSIAAILSSLDQGNTLTAVVENCPENVRYSGIAFAYNLGMALFGGTAPLLVTLLTEKFNPIAPAYYLFIMTGITLLTITTLLSKNRYLKALTGRQP